MARGPLDLWNAWATQILVLLSLTLQVVLLLLAGIRRRREASVLLTFLLWLAYLLADSTAIYTVGHLSLSSAPSKHQLAVFWAPFLLLHLGGPDNITAYSLEDNQLWLRHLQNLVVQVLGAAYVLYKHAGFGRDSYILLAAILMFVVGVVKYAERTWALKCSNLDSIRSSLSTEKISKHQHFYSPDHSSMLEAVEGDDEYCLRRAHSMFHICKRAIVDSWVEKDPENLSFWMLRDIKRLDYRSMWTLMEMELSLMYDLLYTKAGVIHTWSGYSIRVVSSVAAATSLLLFQISSKDGHARINVAVTYALLAGAVLLETASLFNALGSTWTYAFLCTTRWSWLQYAALCSGKWDRLRWLVKLARGSTGSDRSARRWSGRIGQYNMLHFCSRRHMAYKPLLGWIARMLGFKEWWIRYYYSGTIDVSDDLKERLFKYIHELTKHGRAINIQGVIRRNWGQEGLDRDLYKYFKDKKYLGVEFQEGIIIWHISTDVFLAESHGAGDDDDDDATSLVKAIRMMSNYMMFLLVERPYMLPGLAQSMLYRRTCNNLAEMRNKSMHTSIKDFFRLHDEPNSAGLMHVDELASILFEKRPEVSIGVPRLNFSNEVAKKLLEIEEERGRNVVLELLLRLWMDFLLYAANRCSRESHAKKLSNAGEMTTILWIMTDYLHQGSYVLENV